MNISKISSSFIIRKIDITEKQFNEILEYLKYKSEELEEFRPRKYLEPLWRIYDDEIRIKQNTYLDLGCFLHKIGLDFNNFFVPKTS